MPKCFLHTCALFLVLGSLPLYGESSAKDAWPQWMGPRSNGTSMATGVFRDGARIELRESWRLPVAQGYSSISAAGGRAYTLGSDDLTDYVVAVDVRLGKELWRTKIADASGEMPLSTPAVHDGRVFAINGHGALVAVSTEDGRPVWSRDLRQSLGAQRWREPIGESTLILVDRHLIVKNSVGGSLSVVAASPEGYEERATLWVFEAETGVDTPLSFSEGHVFLRNRDEIVAVEVRERLGEG